MDKDLKTYAAAIKSSKLFACPKQSVYFIAVTKYHFL